jgi:mono/diheme cytochrome c family protein
MERPLRIARVPAVCAVLLCLCGFLPAQHIALKAARGTPDDLEVTGLSPSPGYISRAALLKLPQSSAVIEHDPDFEGLVLRVTGVPLETLEHALGVPPTDDLIDMLCTDRYRSHYPADYVQQHHPILVLRIEGKTPVQWAAATRNEDPGPYFVAHAHYAPAFKVLSHEDQRQVPTNVVRMNVTTQQATYGPIAPPGPATRQVEQGFTIAKQNCLRCHAEGSVGGTKSNFNWRILAAIAKHNPSGFERYARNPREIDPHATMPASPQYDDATLAALTAYFQAIAVPESIKP